MRGYLSIITFIQSFWLVEVNFINPFNTTDLILYPLKTLENLWFSWTIERDQWYQMDRCHVLLSFNSTIAAWLHKEKHTDICIIFSVFVFVFLLKENWNLIFLILRYWTEPELTGDTKRAGKSVILLLNLQKSCKKVNLVNCVSAQLTLFKVNN